jgi:hypothetical protein
MRRSNDQCRPTQVCFLRQPPINLGYPLEGDAAWRCSGFIRTRLISEKFELVLFFESVSSKSGNGFAVRTRDKTKA